MPNCYKNYGSHGTMHAIHMEKEAHWSFVAVPAERVRWASTVRTSSDSRRCRSPRISSSLSRMRASSAFTCRAAARFSSPYAAIILSWSCRATTTDEYFAALSACAARA